MCAIIKGMMFMYCSTPHYSLLKLIIAIITVLLTVFYNIGYLLIFGEPAIKAINNVFTLSVFFMLGLALLIILKSSSNYSDKNEKPILFLMMGTLILGVSFMSTHIGFIFALFSGDMPSPSSLVLMISVWGLLYFLVDPLAGVIMEKKVPILSGGARFGLNVAFIIFAYLMYKNDFSSEYTFYFTIAALLQIGFRFILVSTLFMYKDNEGKLVLNKARYEQ